MLKVAKGSKVANVYEALNEAKGGQKLPLEVVMKRNNITLVRELIAHGADLRNIDRSSHSRPVRVRRPSLLRRSIVPIWHCFRWEPGSL